MFLVRSVYCNLREHSSEVWHIPPGTPVYAYNVTQRDGFRQVHEALASGTRLARAPTKAVGGARSNRCRIIPGGKAAGVWR